MRRTPEELRRLATPEFSRILETDPELIRLEAEKYDKNGSGWKRRNTIKTARRGF